MYNESIKKRYIEEKSQTTRVPKNYLECQFNKLEKYEEEYDKDVCCFTTEKLESFINCKMYHHLKSWRV